MSTIVFYNKFLECVKSNTKKINKTSSKLSYGQFLFKERNNILLHDLCC